MTNTNNATNNNNVSSPTTSNFPLAFDTKHNISCSSQPNSILNGLSENVTVTHFSETRNAMERISVPSDNIFNAEVTSPKLDNTVRAANSAKPTEKEAAETQPTNGNNPFLNMSPTTIASSSSTPQSTVIVTTITSTNPFIPTSNYSSPSLAISNPFRDGDNDNKPVAKVESNALNNHTPVDTKEEEKKVADKVVSTLLVKKNMLSPPLFVVFLVSHLHFFVLILLLKFYLNSVTSSAQNYSVENELLIVLKLLLISQLVSALTGPFFYIVIDSTESIVCVSHTISMC